MYIFRSVFEIKSPYQIKYLMLHARVRIWPQDLRWLSSLCGRKHHSINNLKLNAVLGVILVQLQNFTGQESEMRVLVSDKLLARERLIWATSARLSACSPLVALLSCRGGGTLQMSSLVGLLRHPELLTPGHPGKDKCRGPNCLSEICQGGSLSEQTQGNVMSMSF